MDTQARRVRTLPFAPALWITASTPLIFFSLLSAAYIRTLARDSGVLASIITICFPSLCVSFIQYFLRRPARPPLWRWLIACTIGTAMGLVMGWVVLLGSSALLSMPGAYVMFDPDRWLAAAASGGLSGLISGSVTGIFASLGQWVALRLDRRLTAGWFVANVICWGLGLAAMGALVFGLLARIRFSF